MDLGNFSLFTSVAYLSYLPYIILIILIIYLLFTAYIRITYKFWSYQPVVHYYKFWHRWMKPHIINPELPELNKFCNYFRVEVSQWTPKTRFEYQQIIYFIREHYLRGKNTQYLPSSQHILPYFQNHNYPCYVAIYHEPQSLFDSGSGALVPNKEILGLILIRPLYVTYKDTSFPVYYADYLCVHKNERKKGIAPDVIQTYIHHTRHENKNIKIQFFKRETNLTGIVPLVLYTSYGFTTSQINTLSSRNLGNIQTPIQILEINKQNMSLFLNMVKDNKQKFSCTVTPHLSNICELLKSQNIVIYLAHNNLQNYGIYCFRNTATYYKYGGDKQQLGIELFASICESKKSNKNMDLLFYEGFHLAYRKITEKFKNGILIMENISDNTKLVEIIRTHCRPVFTSPTAFFFYNYAAPTLKSKDVFILY